MGAEDGDGARRHVLQSLDEARAFRLERFDHVAIVDDLMAHVDGSAMFGQRPLDNIDRSNNAGAKPARLSKYDLHPLAFSSEPRRASQNRRRQAQPTPASLVTNSEMDPYAATYAETRLALSPTPLMGCANDGLKGQGLA